MFFVSGMSKNMMRGSESTIGTRFKVAAVVCFLVITALAVALDWKVTPKGAPFNAPPNRHQIAFLNTLKLFECIYFGMSMTFLIFGAILVHQVAPSMKVKMLVIYLCISWLLVSWYPHIHLHQFFPSVWGLIVIDLLFHITSAFVAFLLSFYIVKIMKAATATKVRTAQSWHPKELIKSDFVQFVIISIVIGSVAFGFGQYIPKMKSPTTHTQEVILNILFYAESCFMGSAFAVVIFAIPLIKKMKTLIIKVKSIVLTFTLWWTLASWYPHLRFHFQDDKMGLFSPSYFITVEAVFHWSVMVSSIMLAWVAGNLILLSVNLSNSPFQKSVENSRNSQRKSKGLQNSSTANISDMDTTATNITSTDDSSFTQSTAAESNSNEMVEIPTHVIDVSPEEV